MIFERHGQIFIPEDHQDFGRPYASVPFARHLSGDLFRVYYSSRNEDNSSFGCYFDYDVVEKVVSDVRAKPPLIERGGRGLFDESGVTLSSYDETTGRIFYLGWSLRTRVPFSNQIGSGTIDPVTNAIVRDSQMPCLRKCDKEPFNFGYPLVLKVGELWYMWYDAITSWLGDDDSSEFVSALRCATSTDGENWIKREVACLEPVVAEGEIAITRPAVWFSDSTFRMFYSIGNKTIGYRLGYAESGDGFNWLRKDHLATLGPSGEGWDSDEISYPSVFKHKGSRYMLYNGNQFGRTGIGLAEFHSC